MKRIQAARQRAQRRGISVLEVSAASVVLIMAFALLAQMLYLVARHERTAGAQGVAVQTVANELETMLAQDWDALTIGEPEPSKVPSDAARLLHQAALSRQVSAGDDPDTKQLRVKLTWRDATGQLSRPVTLVAWKHRPAAKEEP